MSADHREQFERDFDRALFSTPVRRLQDKAQVFPLDPNDSVRTRLTHSLEVSTLSRGLATAIAKWLLSSSQIDPTMDRQIEAIAATCGLIHDLGNPPFGHAGEEAIASWCQERIDRDVVLKDIHPPGQLRNDFCHFEGNAQTIRLVTKLQILADLHGLNLTFGTLSAACKYIPASHEVVASKGSAWKKHGYFASESESVTTIRAETGTGLARNPITYIVEAADDLCYSVVDIEDAVSKRLWSWIEIDSYIRQELPTGCPIYEDVLALTCRILGVSSLSGSTDQNIVRAFRTAAISRNVEGVIKAFQMNYDRIMDGTYSGDLASDSSTAPFIKACKAVGKKYVYATQDNLKLELRGRVIIHDLLSLFWDGAKLYDPDPKAMPKGVARKIIELMSANYRVVFCASHASPLPLAYRRLQLVTDYVCGMTDTFAMDLHRHLNNG